jgi:hypothetical protein
VAQNAGVESLIGTLLCVRQCRVCRCLVARLAMRIFQFFCLPFRAEVGYTPPKSYFLFFIICKGW